jgi:hypothetical protein
MFNTGLYAKSVSDAKYDITSEFHIVALFVARYEIDFFIQDVLKAT